MFSTSFIFYKHYLPLTSKVHLDFKSYRVKLAESLIGNYNSRKKYSIPSAIYQKVSQHSITPTKKRRVSDRSFEGVSTSHHFPIKGRKQRCVYCEETYNMRHESSVRCDQCDVALCVDTHHGQQSCFKLFHLYNDCTTPILSNKLYYIILYHLLSLVYCI